MKSIAERIKNMTTVTSTTESTQVVLARTVLDNAYEMCGKKVASVPVSLMKLDHSYQRVLSPNVKKLMEKWDNEKCNFLLVSYRDGYFYIIDGQHRYSVAVAKGIVLLPCIILTGLTQHDEALKFARQNEGVTKLNPFDTFKANVACGDTSIDEVKIDIEIKRVCDLHNVKVKKVSTDNNPKALRSLTRARSIVKTNGAECLDWILAIIENSNWNLCKDAYAADIMVMLKNFYVENIDNISAMEDILLTSVLNSVTPTDLIAMAKYSYSEYAVVTALGLCLKDLTKR